MRAVKRWGGVLAALGFFVFMILMPPAAYEFPALFGWYPFETFLRPFGIAFAVTLVCVAVWALCGWIVRMGGVE